MHWTKLLFLVVFIYDIQKSCGTYQSQDPLTKSHSASLEAFCSFMPDWTFIADPLDCHKFYACIHKRGLRLECPQHFYYNNTELRCLPGDCKVKKETPQRYEVVSVPGDCQKFILHLGDKRMLQQCPLGQYFDTEFKICRNRDSSPNFHCRCGGLPNHSTLPNKQNCATYYTCGNGRALLHNCSEGSYYNASINSCLRDANNSCLQQTKEPNDAVSNDNGFCKESEDDGEFIELQSSPNSCNEYRFCIRGKIFTQRCREGYYFDDEFKYCRFDAEQKCIKQNRTEETPTEGHELKTTTEGPTLVTKNTVNHLQPNKTTQKSPYEELLLKLLQFLL